MLPAVIHTTQKVPKERSNRGKHLLIWFLILLILLIAALTASWFFLAHPFIHDKTQKALNNGLDRAEENIRPPSLFMSGITISIPEQTMNNLLISNIPPSMPIREPTLHITTSTVRLDFQTYNFPCDISVVPSVSNGHLVVNDVHIDGIVGLIMSPNDIKNLLDSHLAHAQQLFGHPLTKLQLKDHELDVTF